MIITAKANGDVLNIKPSVFYQGSTEANRIYLITPFAINSSVNIGFTLPNTHDIPVTLMTPSTEISDTLNTWVYDVPVAITQYVGIVKVNISITTPSGSIITLNRCQFEVKRGDEVVLPEPPEADVYAIIVQALAQINADYINKVDISYTDTENEISQGIVNNSLGLKLYKTVGDITVYFEITENGVEIDGIDIKEQVLNAVATANEAKSIAENAESVANGIDAKASEALSNSETAVSTANEAKAIALGIEQAKVFDTFEDMETWLKDEANKGLHTTGLELLIKSDDVPDYWVTAVLETPNASGYYYDIEENEASVLSVNGKKGIVVLKTDDVSDAEQTNKWSTADEKEKISKIVINGDGTKALLNDGTYGEVGTVDTVNGVLPDENKNITITADDIAYDEDYSVKDELDIKVNTADIINNLMSTDTNKPLSALQGKNLKDIIDTKNFGKSFNTISDMVSDLNSAGSTDYRTAFNLLIVALEVPDFWITEIMASSVAYTYTTDQALIDAVAITPVQIGFYKISKLETAKVDLSNYANLINNNTWTGANKFVGEIPKIVVQSNTDVYNVTSSFKALGLETWDKNGFYTGAFRTYRSGDGSTSVNMSARNQSNVITTVGLRGFANNTWSFLQGDASGVVDIGLPTNKFKNAYFSDTVNSENIVITGNADIINMVTTDTTQTINGEKTFTSNLFVAKSGAYIFAKDTGLEYNVAPASDVYTGFEIRDKNNVYLASTRVRKSTNNNTQYQIAVRNKDNIVRGAQLTAAADGSFAFEPIVDNTVDLGGPTLRWKDIYVQGSVFGAQKDFTATLPNTGWTGTSAPYSKEVTVTGILATDKLDYDLNLDSSSYADVPTIQSAWFNVYKTVASANTITFYSHEIPSIDIPLTIKVVR